MCLMYQDKRKCIFFLATAVCFRKLQIYEEQKKPSIDKIESMLVRVNRSVPARKKIHF